MTDIMDTRPGLQTRRVLVHGAPPDFPFYNWTLLKIANNPDGTVEAVLTAIGPTVEATSPS